MYTCTYITHSTTDAYVYVLQHTCIYTATHMRIYCNTRAVSKCVLQHVYKECIAVYTHVRECCMVCCSIRSVLQWMCCSICIHKGVGSWVYIYIYIHMYTYTYVSTKRVHRRESSLYTYVRAFVVNSMLQYIDIYEYVDICIQWELVVSRRYIRIRVVVYVCIDERVRHIHMYKSSSYIASSLYHCI